MLLLVAIRLVFIKLEVSEVASFNWTNNLFCQVDVFLTNIIILLNFCSTENRLKDTNYKFGANNSWHFLTWRTQNNQVWIPRFFWVRENWFPNQDFSSFYIKKEARAEMLVLDLVQFSQTSAQRPPMDPKTVAVV